MNIYMLVFNPVDDGRSAMTDFLDTLVEVKDWHASLNHAVVVVSSADSTVLTERVRDRFPGVRFVITPLDPPSTNGILPRATWDFVESAAASDAIGGRTATTCRANAVVEPSAA